MSWVVPWIIVMFALAMLLAVTVWSKAVYVYVPEGRMGLYVPKGTQPNASTPTLDSGTHRRRRGCTLTTYPVVSVPEGCLGLVYDHTGQIGWQQYALAGRRCPTIHPFANTVVVIGETESGSVRVYGDSSVRDEDLNAQIDTILDAQPCVMNNDSGRAITIEPDSIDPDAEDQRDRDHAGRLEGRLIDYRDVTFTAAGGHVTVKLCIGSPANHGSEVVQGFVTDTLRPNFEDLSFPTVAEFVLAITEWNSWLGDELDGCYRVSVESAMLRLPA